MNRFCLSNIMQPAVYTVDGGFAVAAELAIGMDVQGVSDLLT